MGVQMSVASQTHTHAYTPSLQREAAAAAAEVAKADLQHVAMLGGTLQESVSVAESYLARGVSLFTKLPASTSMVSWRWQCCACGPAH